MEVSEAINKRKSVRSYLDKEVPESIMRDLVDAGRKAPSACNLQLTEYVVVNDKRLLDNLSKKVTMKFTWAPAYIVLIYDSRFTVKRHSAQTSLGASMENILLKATSMGLGACPMAGFRHDSRLKKILKIPNEYKIGLIISVGYEDNREEKEIEKVPIDEVIHLNSYSSSKHKLEASMKLGKWSLLDLKEYRSRMAPVYLYKGRFNLMTFDPSIYDKALSVLDDRIDLKNKDILDYLSYDSYFAKNLSEKLSESQVSVSDIISHPLEVFKKTFPNSNGYNITSFHKTDSKDGNFDIVTFVHKAEFNPNIDKALTEFNRILKPGGYIFVTTTHMTWYKRLSYWLRFKYKKFIKREIVNVYENNPYYKIGPFRYLKPNKLKKLAAKSGFRHVDSGTETVDVGRLDHRFFWMIYQKT